MGRCHPTMLVTVYPFTHRVDGDEAIIANAARSSFLAIPTPALDLLVDLAAGRTTGQAQAAFAQKYGETPDLEDFLDLLEREGFLTLGEATATDDPDVAPVAPASGPLPRHHLENISEETARRLFSRPVLLGCGLLIGLALLAVALDPGLLPSPTVMVFDHDLTPLTLAVTTFVLATIFLHELAHLVAARAAGVPARLGVGNRLWYLVAETDLTGVWLASRRQRYLAFLAGPLLDATSGAALILVLWANRHGLWLPPLAALLGSAFLFTYLVRLLWQCYFFLRTDLYYVVATFFNCKNLLDDTRDWLGNQLARVWPALRVVDQSAIPPAERRVIRAYAVVWLTGRGLAFASLFLISVPILWGYCRELVFLGAHGSPVALLDALLWTGLVLAGPGVGLVLWLRDLYRSRSRIWRLAA